MSDDTRHAEFDINLARLDKKDGFWTGYALWAAPLPVVGGMAALDPLGHLQTAMRLALGSVAAGSAPETAPPGLVAVAALGFSAIVMYWLFFVALFWLRAARSYRELLAGLVPLALFGLVIYKPLGFLATRLFLFLRDVFSDVLDVAVSFQVLDVAGSLDEAGFSFSSFVTAAGIGIPFLVLMALVPLLLLAFRYVVPGTPGGWKRWAIVHAAGLALGLLLLLAALSVQGVLNSDFAATGLALLWPWPHLFLIYRHLRRAEAGGQHLTLEGQNYLGLLLRVMALAALVIVVGRYVPAISFYDPTLL